MTMKPGMNQSELYPSFFIRLDAGMVLRGIYIMNDFGYLVRASDAAVHQFLCGGITDD